MNGHADFDACPDRIFVERFTALGHIGNGLAEAIPARAIGDRGEDVLQSYAEDGGSNYLAAAAMLPSRFFIDDACAELMSLMFPGFRGEPLVDSSDLPQVTKSRLRNLQSRLNPEFCKSLGKFPPDAAVEKRADELLPGFLSELTALRKMRWTDVDAAYA